MRLGGRGGVWESIKETQDHRIALSSNWSAVVIVEQQQGLLGFQLSSDRRCSWQDQDHVPDLLLFLPSVMLALLTSPIVLTVPCIVFSFQSFVIDLKEALRQEIKQCYVIWCYDILLLASFNKTRVEYWARQGWAGLTSHMKSITKVRFAHKTSGISSK